MDNVREKLLEMFDKAVKICGETRCDRCDYFASMKCVDERVADYLAANGVTVLPCKLGDTAWGIKRCNLGNVVKQGEVYQMYFGEDMRLCICVKNVCRGEWGVNVFGTKEEAEEAVGKMAKKE